MLDAAGKDWLIEELGATIELAGQEVRPAALALLVSDLAHLPQALLRISLARIRAEHRGPILAGTVLQYVDHAMGRLLPAEAYALAVSGQDEHVTLVWNNEIATAWGVAAPLMAAGDKFGARQAFMEAYGRITGEARALRRMPELQVSFGHDVAGRVRALAEAEAAGRLPGGQDGLPEAIRDQLLLPAPRSALSLPAPADCASPAKAKAFADLARLRHALTRGGERQERIQRVRAWQDQRRTRALKRKAAAAVAEWQSLQGATQ